MQAARGASLTDQDADDDGATGVTSAALGAGSRRPLTVFALVALGCYLLDLATKSLALAKLGDEPVEIVGSLLKLNLTFNPGAAFSTGTSYTVLLSCIAVVAVVTVLWYARRLRSLMWAVGLGALLGECWATSPTGCSVSPASCAGTLSTSCSYRTGRSSTSPTSASMWRPASSSCRRSVGWESTVADTLTSLPRPMTDTSDLRR